VRLDRKDLAVIAFSFALVLTSCNGGGGPDKTPTKIPKPMPTVDALDKIANYARGLYGNDDSEETPAPIQANMNAIKK